MAMQKKGWMIIYPSSNGYIFQYIWGRGGGGSQENYHLLILNMHGLHVTIEALQQATMFGFHMVDLLSLLWLLTRKTNGNLNHFRLFLDYSNSHVVTSNWNKRKSMKRLWTKSKNLKQRKGIRKDQNKSIIHLPKLNKWFEEALKRKIKLHSTKNGLLMQLRLLVNGSTTILE